jgi:secreted Zn-dependent insulinase-like peptidase
MSSEVFETHRAALEVKIAEKPKTIVGRGSALWGQIKSGRYNFREQELELDELKKVTLERTRALFRVT